MIYVLSGGGSGLNLKVVGGTIQPTGSENMVWVNTDTTISGWAFSATEPESPNEGMVWIKTGLPILPINIDKKNTVEIYPTVCYQYASGAWKVKTGKAYINDAWTTIDDAIRIVDEGTYNIAVVGGWSVAAKKWYNNSYSALAPVMVDTLDKLSFTMTGPDYKVWQGCVYSDEDIDFTNYNTIYVEGIASGGQNNGLAIAVRNRNNAYALSESAASTEAFNGGTDQSFSTTLDISSVSGKYALSFGLQVQNMVPMTIDITKLIID